MGLSTSPGWIRFRSRSAAFPTCDADTDAEPPVTGAGDGRLKVSTNFHERWSDKWQPDAKKYDLDKVSRDDGGLVKMTLPIEAATLFP